ncbi:MAG: MFS transporter, partial [Candidatus Accumulibacter sp.]|jgi:DHA2 family multidrug resistance protein|nr:MFS transporter [Accumulibacter sp.]
MALEAMRQQGMSQEQALAAINRSIDIQAATMSATEFFWASGVVFLILMVLAMWSKPARPAAGGFGKANH